MTNQIKNIQLIEQIIQGFDKLSPLEQYKIVEANRSLLRDLQKISYRVAQFDKRYPLEEVSEKDYKGLLEAYLEFLIEAREIDLVAGKGFLFDKEV